MSVAHMAERDMNNLTEEGESSSSKSDFDENPAQGVFDDWVVS